MFSLGKLPGLLKTKESGRKLKKLRGCVELYNRVKSEESEQDSLPSLGVRVFCKGKEGVSMSQLLTT